MSIFRWAMRHGAVILFWTSLIVFAVTLISQTFFDPTSRGMGFPGEPGQSSARARFIVTTLTAALSNSALIFASACIVELLQRRSETRMGGRQ